MASLPIHYDIPFNHSTNSYRQHTTDRRTTRRINSLTLLKLKINFLKSTKKIFVQMQRQDKGYGKKYCAFDTVGSWVNVPKSNHFWPGQA